MANFIENLWSSVFTPGTTPTLLLATNATFAALQLTLFGLLVATYSYHFVALSLLCAGLWWAINWFAMELARAEAVEKEAEEIRKRKGAGSAGKESAGGSDEGDVDEDSETETETEAGRTSGRTGLVDREGGPGIRIRGGPQKARAVMQSASMEFEEGEENPTDQGAQAHPHGVQIRGGPQKILGVMKSADEARKGRGGWAGEEASGSGLLAPEGSDRADLSSSSMTDSEWEKVSEGGREG